MTVEQEDGAAPSIAPPRRRGPWIRIARVGRVPLYLDPLLPLLLAAVAVLGPTPHDLVPMALALLSLVGFVVVHEVGHAWMARRRHLAVAGIYLHLFPVTYVDAGSPSDQWRIALAGPVANLLLAVPLLGLHAFLGGGWDREGWARDPLRLAAAVNIGMAGLNLVPFLPADGGRVVRALLALRWGRRPARRAVGWAGIAAGLAGTVLALTQVPYPLGTWMAVLALYVAWVSTRELSPTSPPPPRAEGGRAKSSSARGGVADAEAEREGG